MIYESCGTTTVEGWDKGEAREFLIMQYIEVTVPLGVMEKNMLVIVQGA